MTETATGQAWKFGDPTPNLNAALSALQGELPEIPKTKTGEINGQNKKGEWYSYEYHYADLADVSRAVAPLMAKHGLAFSSQPDKDPDDKSEMILTWKLKHASGEEDRGTYPLGPVRQKPQSLGSMLTYARRYCKLAALDIVAEEDDDGKRAQALSRSSSNGRESAGNAFDGAAGSRPNGNGSNGNSRTGSAFDNAAPAPEVPPKLEQGDEWAERIADVKTAAEADELDKELRQLFQDGTITAERAKQVKYWLDVKVAPMRTAANSARPESKPASKPADPPAGADQWCIDFVTRLAATPLEGLTGMRGEIGRAVAARTITPEDGNAMSTEVAKRRKGLEQEPQAEGAEAA